ncbi:MULTISPECIES: ROK family protein [unclassified Arthrobacter]|uniref:ROK family protein n=1 Tax=unclassified Arthrobacter TaxID=235627 RepID=UPI001491951F|nr:ROK family transcriptional regulator [Arthrobacter sp. AET 35A]MBE0008640.1 ROK family transcriptional regulator [Arthrobacter sp. AET 35A]NOJ62473.1 ROK family transcriptional regulator [Arthrobacter sp. 147(2020)]
MKEVLPLPADSPARIVAREVLVRGPISRSELARTLGLSAASLTRLSRPLLEAGILQEGIDVQAGQVGRPTRPLDIRPEAHRFVGIKLTGDTASGVATDLRCRPTASSARPLDSHAVDDVVDVICALIGDLSAGGGFSGIGISLGGKVGSGEASGVVQRAPFLGWREVPLARLVQERLGIPVVLANDVVALTVAQQWFGAGRGIPNFAVLTIGAGVGYGLVINDRVIAPPDAGLGLVGHYPLSSSGPLCSVGHRGCSTAMLTMPGITEQLAPSTGIAPSYAEVLQQARDNHPEALSVITSAGTALGTLIAAIANLTMVQTVILSGEGMDLAAVAAEPIDAALSAHRDPEAHPIQLVREPADFGQWARGAAAVVIQQSIVGALT